MKPSETGPQKCLSVHDISKHVDGPTERDRFYEVHLEHTHKGKGRVLTVTIGKNGLLRTTKDGKYLSRQKYGVYEVKTL